MRVRNKEFLSWSFLETILSLVGHDADDFQRRAAASIASATFQSELRADRVFTGPVALGHRLVDESHSGSVLRVKLIKEPALQQPRADG